MKIWVDADGCPGPVREVVVRAANRLQVQAVFVANKPVRVPFSPYVSAVQVAMGLDVADSHIAHAASAGDLAVTADVPLAAALVARRVVVIDPRGRVYDEENIGEVLALRNFMHELREGGLQTGGPGGFGARDAKEFASSFDRELTRAMRAGIKE